MAREDLFAGQPAHFWFTVWATARAYLQRVSAYTIQLVRWPLGPLITFAVWRVTYGIAGRGHVEGATISGFLLVGIFGLIMVTSSIWVSGYALEWERDEGTSGALFLSPASRAAVVAGYGLGGLIWFVPALVVLGILALVTGAHFHITDPVAVLLSVAALVLASFAAGFALAGIFILSRRGNLIANVCQQPIYLLAGLMVPRAFLPGWLQGISNVLPIAHATDALRATALTGASLQLAARPLTLALLTSATWLVIGIVGLRRLEYIAKRHGQLDLF